MSIDLKTALPSLIPGAIAWAEARAKEVTESGVALNESDLELARSVGVEHPELIRVTIVDSFPLPEDPMLRAAALQAGLLGDNIAGLTLGHSILIRRGQETRRVRSHEFRHVHQYEQHGSIARFLPVYLWQIVDFGGRWNAPLEKDAIDHEQIDT